MIRLSGDDAERIADFMKSRGVELFVRGEVLRLVTHRDLADEDVDRVVDLFREFRGG